MNQTFCRESGMDRIWLHGLLSCSSMISPLEGGGKCVLQLTKGPDALSQTGVSLDSMRCPEISVKVMVAPR